MRLALRLILKSLLCCAKLSLHSPPAAPNAPKNLLIARRRKRSLKAISRDAINEMGNTVCQKYSGEKVSKIHVPGHSVLLGS